MKFKFLMLMFLCVLAAPLFADNSLRPGDTIEIRLTGVDPQFVSEFTQAITLDEKGYINLTYIGQIKASGMGATDLQTLIEQKLKTGKIYTHPTITINIPQGNRFVNVSGSVRAPGRVPYQHDLTVMTAIGAVGGFDDYANGVIELTRDGKKMILKRKEIDKVPTKDIKVQPGDVINAKRGIF